MSDRGKGTIPRDPLGLRRSQLPPPVPIACFSHPIGPCPRLRIFLTERGFPSFPLGDPLRIREGAKSIGWWVLGLQGSIIVV